MDHAALIADEAWIIHRILEAKAAATPDHPFMHYDGHDHTYAQMNARADRIAAGLAGLGIKKGDRVAVIMQSSPEYIDVWFAIAKLGAIEIPVNIAYKGELLRHVLVTAGAVAIVLDDEFAEVVAEVTESCPDLTRHVVNPTTGENPPRLPGEVALADLLACEDGPPQVEVAHTDVACIMFTSGTTGPSKGVIIEHHFEWAFGVTVAEIVDIRGDDVAYNFLPFFHVAGKFVLMAAMLVDARMIMRQRFSVAAFWPDIRAFGCTITVAVGGICHMLNAEPEREDDADNPLRVIYAVPIPAEFQAAFEKRFGLVFIEAYGSTEANVVAASQPGASPTGSFGKAGRFYEIEIHDESDNPCPPGVAGEIVVRPKRPGMLLTGYYKLPEKSLEAMRNLWFHTGDQGMADADGWFFFLDRLTDSIRRRGENISSFEVERIVNTHEAVAESAAIAVPSELQEDEVKLVVVLKPGRDLTEEALLRFCIDEMPYFMVPRFVEFRDDLPRTSLTKIRKVELRAEGRNEATWDCEAHGLRITRNGLVPLAAED